MYERTYHTRVLKSDQQPRQNRPIPWKRIIRIGLVVVIAVGMVCIVRMSQFQIRTVEVTGTEVADPIEIADFALTRLEGTYAWILPRSSIFLVAPDRVARQLHDAFPRFKEVTVSRASMHGLTVQVREYPGVYLWCDDACSFMDEQGTVFADAPYFSGSAYIKVYKGERQPYPFLPLDSDALAVLQAISTQLTAVDIAPIEIHFENEHKVTVVFFHHRDRAELYFDPTTSIQEAVDTLFSGLRTDPLAALYHSSAHTLHYIDLRFSNKVVYKFD